MTNPLETAHQYVKTNAGILATAATVGITPTHLTDILQGRRPISPQIAYHLSQVTGQTVQSLVSADADQQLLNNKNSAL